MARTFEVLRLFVLAALVAAPLSAFAQAPQPEQAAPEAAVPTASAAETQGAPVNAQQLSAQCSVPTTEIAAPAPLPTTVMRLEASKPLRILAIGSSSTWGVGATSRRKNYPSQLEIMLERVLKTVPIEVVNRGVSGETAETTAERLRIEAALLKPDLVLWQVGTNDAVQRVSVENFERTVGGTVSLLRKKNIDVVLVGLQYTPKYARDEHYFAIRDALKRVATEQNVLYVRRYQAMEYITKTKANLQMMADDDFHLNDLGYQCMAEHIAQAMTANLFVRRRKPAS
jgi:lysophospholipase L1-like esterase